jgi:hypothetical protein
MLSILRHLMMATWQLKHVVLFSIVCKNVVVWADIFTLNKLLNMQKDATIQNVHITERFITIQKWQFWWLIWSSHISWQFSLYTPKTDFSKLCQKRDGWRHGGISCSYAQCTPRKRRLASCLGMQWVYETVIDSLFTCRVAFSGLFVPKTGEVSREWRKLHREEASSSFVLIPRYH